VRHNKANAKLSKPTDQRMALLRSLARAFFISKSITTTKARAKQAKMQIERLITLVKKADLSSKRQVLEFLQDKEVVKQMYVQKEIFNKRTSGYTRIIPIGTRRGDAAEMVKLELVDLG